MGREYKNVIFSDHALQRMRRRRIDDDLVVKVVRQPDDKQTEDNGNTRFIKQVKDRNVHVVGSYLPDDKKWLIVSTWVRGEEDPRPLWVQVIRLPVLLVRGLWRMLRR